MKSFNLLLRRKQRSLCGICLLGIWLTVFQFSGFGSTFAQRLKAPAPFQASTETEQQSPSNPSSEPVRQSLFGEEVRCFVKFRAHSTALAEVVSLFRANSFSTTKNSKDAYSKDASGSQSISFQSLSSQGVSVFSPTLADIHSSALTVISQQALALETVSAKVETISEQEAVSGINRLFILHVSEEQILRGLITTLQNHPDIEYIEPEQMRSSGSLQAQAATEELTNESVDDKNAASLTQSANDQYFQNQWSLLNTGQSLPTVFLAGKAGADVNITKAWGITTGSSNIIVAMIDTGVPNPSSSSTAVDFSNRFVSSYNFALKTTDASDNDGHGSNIASIIGAMGNNGRLVAGINWQSRLMPLKVSTQRGTIPNSLLVQAIIYAADQGARVINMSLGGTNYSNAELDALRYAAAKGCINVAAMGNDNYDTPTYPAAFSTDPTTNVIAVGATDNYDRRCNPFSIGSRASGGSNFGAHISFTAPGNAILGIGANGASLAYYSGTSQATPIVSGIISLLLSAKPSMKFQDVVNALKAGARDMVGLSTEDTPGWDKYYGWGRVDAYRSLAYITTDVQASVPSTTTVQKPLLYPNPASSLLYLTILPHPSEAISVALVDMLGRTLLEHTLQPSANTYEVDVSALATGAYRLVLKRSAGVEALPAFIVH